ncbi:hypothetical protein FACS1894167_04010 [Synergistales bacterium]|nr:hypothetical protein FACS1894167_04010 [Synergistales bacterium]
MCLRETAEHAWVKMEHGRQDAAPAIPFRLRVGHAVVKFSLTNQTIDIIIITNMTVSNIFKERGSVRMFNEVAKINQANLQKPLDKLAEDVIFVRSFVRSFVR